MGKQTAILLLLFVSYTFVYGQRWMKTATPCDKELLLNTPGEWMKMIDK